MKQNVCHVPLVLFDIGNSRFHAPPTRGNEYHVTLTVSFNFDFSQKSQSKGLIYFKEGYVHNMSVSKNAVGTIIIAARCYRSMRKGESAHRMSIDLKDSVVANAYCSCTAG